MRISDVLETQAKLTRSIEGPASRHLEMQEQMQRLAEGPLYRYETQQRKLQEQIEGPAKRYLEMQDQMRRLAEGPLASYQTQQGKRYLEMQRQIQQAMEGPLASFLVDQVGSRDATAPFQADDVRDLAEALAVVEPKSEPEVSFSPLTVWLSAAVRLPSVARLRLALELVGIALAVAAFAEASAGADVDDTTEWVQAALGLLIGLAGYLLRFVDDDS